MRKTVLLLFTFFFIVSCRDKNKIPQDILPKEKMQAVLWSMITAGEFLNGYILNKDSVDKVVASSKIYGQVFQIHSITREEFDKSYSYYKAHPDLMKVILDSLSKKPAYMAEKFTPGPDTPIKKKVLKEEK